MENVIIIAILVVIVGFAVRYVCKSRKKGVKCIGCPDACNCSASGCKSGCGGCGNSDET